MNSIIMQTEEKNLFHFFMCVCTYEDGDIGKYDCDQIIVL